jgi:hypothetical protein
MYRDNTCIPVCQPELRRMLFKPLSIRQHMPVLIRYHVYHKDICPMQPIHLVNLQGLIR